MISTLFGDGPATGDAAPSGLSSVLAGRYELGPLVGRGGSARVYQAWDRRCGRVVAVKVFTPGVEPPARHRQDQELQVLARFEHPGLVALFDAGVDAEQSYLVMQLVEGPSLAQRLSEGPLPLAQVAYIGASLGEALVYVHAQGVTHRDLKPGNVLLDHGEQPLLVDFGIALLVDVTRVTATGAVLGTAGYMAPEQLRGDPVGPAADVYALGLVLLEALTGQRAYSGTSAEAVLARLHRVPEVPDGLPGGLTPLLRAMTLDRPDDRPSTTAVTAALTAATDELAGGPAVVVVDQDTISSSTEPLAVRPAALSSKQWTRRRAVAAALVGAALAVGGLVGVISLSEGPAGTATGAVAPPAAGARAVPGIDPVMANPAAAAATSVPGPVAQTPSPAPSGRLPTPVNDMTQPETAGAIPPEAVGALRPEAAGGAPTAATGARAGSPSLATAAATNNPPTENGHGSSDGGGVSGSGSGGGPGSAGGSGSGGRSGSGGGSGSGANSGSGAAPDQQRAITEVPRTSGQPPL